MELNECCPFPLTVPICCEWFLTFAQGKSANWKCVTKNIFGALWLTQFKNVVTGTCHATVMQIAENQFFDPNVKLFVKSSGLRGNI